MAYFDKSIVSRMKWCRRQKTQARPGLELDGWYAEEEGLRDALFNRDHTDQYRNGPHDVFERYVIGLQDGLAMIRAAAVDQHQSTHRQ